MSYREPLEAEFAEAVRRPGFVLLAFDLATDTPPAARLPRLATDEHPLVDVGLDELPHRAQQMSAQVSQTSRGGRRAGYVSLPCNARAF